MILDGMMFSEHCGVGKVTGGKMKELNFPVMI